MSQSDTRLSLTDYSSTRYILHMTWAGGGIAAASCLSEHSRAGAHGSGEAPGSKVGFEVYWHAPAIGVDRNEARDEVAGLRGEVRWNGVLGGHDPRKHAVQPRHAATPRSKALSVITARAPQ